MFDEIGNVLGITSTKNGRRRFYYYTNKKGYSLPMGQFDDVVLENIQKILEADLKGILAEDIREGLKFIPKIKFEDTCHIIEKGICSREGKINKIAVYIDVARLREFA
ncbi:MAG: hypothetical protein LBM71_03250, partial [Elusimicrobiota bacterium]|nr:hypothetical protein [Elusimicrobiota bacterium]